nr:radical SAM protein [Herbaspirillum sp. C7C8]
MAHNSCLNASYDLNVLKIGLEKSGYQIVNQPEDADEVIFSGCSVRSKWVDDAINQIDQIHERAPSVKITVTGCVANVNAAEIKSRTIAQTLEFHSQHEILKNRTGLDFKALDRVISQDTSHSYEGDVNNGLTQLRQRVGPEKAEVVATLQKIDREFGTEYAERYQRETKGFVFYNEAKLAELITVTRSCLYKCSFCSIPRGRGPFTSVPLADILFKAKAALERGVKRVILVGDEVGNYGADGGNHKFSDLLTALVALDDQISISIRYIEPKPFIKNAELLKRLCDQGRIDLLYISLQSGSQRILKAMNRNVDIESVAAVYADFRKRTDVVFYCNWMVGFPGETEQDFQKTVQLVKDLDLQISVAIPFSSRPDTPAATLEDQIGEEIKEQRVLSLTRVIADIKGAQYEKHLAFLDAEVRNPLIDLIRAAEMRRYAESKSEARPLTLHERLSD